MTLATINQIKDQNFTSIMVDCGQDWDAELHSVKKLLKHSGLMVRLDFNAKADFSIFERFMTNIEPSTRARIEYVEDPMPFEPESWRDASRLVSLGVESQYSQIPWDSPEKIPPIRALVIRPSRIDANLAVQRALANKMKIVITSSLEHPVSIAHASYLASRLTAKDPTVLSDHDCLYQTFFAPHTFSGTLNSQGPFLSSLDGYGIGFDLKFMTLQWTLLR
jgi:O-succinylbenzoate synthase